MSNETILTKVANAFEPRVPETWPGAFGLYKYSKRTVLLNWQTLVGLIVANILLSALSSVLTNHIRSAFLVVLISLIFQVAAIVLAMLMALMYLAGMRGNTLSISDAFKKLSPRLVINYIVAVILVAVIVIVSALLFLIPLLFVLPRLVVVQYFVLDKNMGALDAIAASWRATSGHALKIWSVLAATVAMALLFLTIIGIPFAIYFLFMYGAATAILYGFVTQKHKA